jgi:SAM-dependent methyltransferase
MDSRRLRRLASLLVKRRKCPFCGWFGFRFEPFGNTMTYRNDAQCPMCGSLERHRAAFLLLRDLIPSNQKTLHVAPEPMMIPWLVSRSCEYLNIDLLSPAMRQMDLMHLDLPSESKTLIWCSHVLEHVTDDQKALSEMFRVLVPGGILILQVPIRGEVTYEDPTVSSESDRLDKFLQEDHVRLYGTDLKQRIEKSGFVCEMLSTESLPIATRIVYALNAPLYREIFVGRKPSSSKARQHADPSQLFVSDLS